MNYNSLKSDIAAVVRQNGNQEITGENLQGVLTEIIDNSVGTGYLYKGIATPETQGGTPDQNVFYLASAGTYGNFGTTIPEGSVGVFRYNGAWSVDILTIGGIYDAEPTLYSGNPVESGGVAKSLRVVGVRFGDTFDVFPYQTRYDNIVVDNNTSKIKAMNGYFVLRPFFLAKSETMETNITMASNVPFVSIVTSDAVPVVGDSVTIIGNYQTYTATNDCYVVISSSLAAIGNDSYIKITNTNSVESQISEIQESTGVFVNKTEIAGVQYLRVVNQPNNQIRPNGSATGTNLYAFDVEEGKTYRVSGYWYIYGLNNEGVMFTDQDISSMTTNIQATRVLTLDTDGFYETLFTAPSDGKICVGNYSTYFIDKIIDVQVWETELQSAGVALENEIKNLKNGTPNYSGVYYGDVMRPVSKAHKFDVQTVGYVLYTAGQGFQGLDVIDDICYIFKQGSAVSIVNLKTGETINRAQTITFESGVTAPHFGNVRFSANSQVNGTKTLYSGNEGTDSHTCVVYQIDTSWNATIIKYFDVPMNERTSELSYMTATKQGHCAIDPESGRGCVFLYPVGYTSAASHDNCEIICQPFSVDLSGTGDVSSSVVSRAEDVFVLPALGGRLQDFYYIGEHIYIISGGYQTPNYPTHISDLNMSQNCVSAQIIIPYTETNMEAQGISAYENDLVVGINITSAQLIQRILLK